VDDDRSSARRHSTVPYPPAVREALRRTLQAFIRACIERETATTAVVTSRRMRRPLTATATRQKRGIRVVAKAMTCLLYSTQGYGGGQ
jgi:hypothetical protein